MNKEKLKQRFEEFNYYNFQLLTPSGNKKAYWAVATIFTIDLVISAVKKELPIIALPIVVGVLLARLGYNAYDWAFEARRTRPIEERRPPEGWERFDRQLQFSGEALAGLAIAGTTVALVLENNFHFAAATLLTTGRQILACHGITKEIGGIDKLMAYRSTSPSPRNNTPVKLFLE